MITKKEQIQALENIIENIKSGKWYLDSVEVRRGVVHKSDGQWVKHHPDGNITMKLEFVDPKERAAMHEFLKDAVTHDA